MPDRTVVSEQVLGALEECQRSFAVHRKCILRLKQAQVADPEEFKETFVECLNRALLVFKREPAVERFVKLVSSFVSFSNDKYARDGDMAATLLEYLIPLTASKDKAVRFRSCQLTAMLLNALGADSEVGEELFEEMADAMLVRLKDKIPVVRVFAASALSRLQDPTDEEDPVTSEYLRLVGSDSSKEVRKAILANIGPSMVTIPHILKRIRDVREDVRKYAYNVVAIKIEARQLSIAQRVDLVGHGLKDRAPIVRKSASEQAWR
ncbi:armadillo-type protein [Baffinella frigidus]|nr:armadillo-type protein [Cryptophyta sp. CCMP2293]